MEYFTEDAINEMANFCRTWGTPILGQIHYKDNFNKRSDFTDEILRKMFIGVFNTFNKFEINENSTCFNYIGNRATVLYEIIMTLKENKYCEGTITQMFNNYWFYVGNHLLHKRKEDTIRRIIDILQA
jgi:hypothetical protein